MKIKKQATTRHETTLSPMIAEFVQATESIPLYQVPAHLAAFPKLWAFPRGDTYHWIPVLNRFDRILELFINEYGLVDGPQTQPFERRLLLKGDAEEGSTPEPATNDILNKLHIAEDGDRQLIEQVLNFTRMLLENCGNRSLYSSSAHLDKLLNTTSISLLKATLRLTLRLSQRYHAARMRLAPSQLHPTLLASHYNINLDKVQKLAGPLPKGPSAPAPLFTTPAGKGKEKTQAERRGEADRFSAADMVGLLNLSESAVKQELGGVSLSYYEPSSTTTEDDKPASADDPSTGAPTTPTPARRTSNLGPQQTPRQPQSSTSFDSPTTPGVTPGDTGGSRPSGPKSFKFSLEVLNQSSIYELVKRGTEELPPTAHYELLHRLRTAFAVTSGHAGRQDVISIRLLAIANLAYIFGEKDFHTRMGQQDTDEPRRLQWAYQLGELVQPRSSGQKDISLEVQTYALNALEALAKHKTKAGDICTALSVNVNHGVLFWIVRQMVTGLGKEDGSEANNVEDEWREALFSLLNTLPTSQQRTGDGMVSAGLLEILVEVLTLRTAKAERNYPKILNFLDTFVHNLREAFQSLVDAKGLDILADLVLHEVTTSYKLSEEGQGMPKQFKTQFTDYQIPFYNQQTLRWLFRFMNHMMSHTGGGNFERQMRNLIDSAPLQQGLKVVLSNASIFGSTVWSMAVNILTTFIHNEPTSYSVINDAGLSTALLETVSGEKISDTASSSTSEDTSSANQGSSAPQPSRVYPPRDPARPLSSGILPVAEAISTIPPAFGAICLAEAGMRLFQSSSALKRFFEIFESPAHVKALDQDPEIAAMIGNSFDELVRHHPPLKSVVLSSLSEMVARVVRICFDKAAKEGAGAKLYYESEDGKIYVCGGRRALAGPEGFVHKELFNGASRGGDIDMDDNSRDTTPVTLGEVIELEDTAKGPTTSQYVSVVCRFLSGFFTNHTMCSAYIEADGVESILDLATLPCLDPRFNESRATTEEFARVVQVLVEQKPHIAVPALLKRTQQALDRLEPLLRHQYQGESAFFEPFTSPQASDTPGVREHGTEYIKSLLVVHTLISALTQTFQTQMFNSRTTHNVASQVNLADVYAKMVDSLGRLHRSCVWEEILLQKNMPTEWEKETRIKSSGFGAIEADSVFHLGERQSAFSADPSDTSENSTAAAGDTTAPSTEETRSAQFKNTQILRYLLSKIPTGIAPFFQSLGRLILFRRNLDSYYKQCAIIVGDQLAQAAIDQLRFEAPKAAQSAEDRFAYWIVILTSLSQLMIDSNMDRASPHTLTLVLVAFKNLGGMAHLADILGTFTQSAKSVIHDQGDEPSEASQRLLNLSLGGIKIVLAFYVQIINSKTINEASQTSTLQSRPDRDRERPDFFLSSQFIVELRHAVTKPVRDIWDSDLIDKATTSIVKTSINILKTILDGEGEQGAFKSIDKIPKRNKPIIRPWAPRNNEHIRRLKDASFDESLAEEALFRCCDNFNAAREYCQNQNRDTRASRNPIPQYEINARGPPSTSASRAEVIVPEHADNASISSGDVFNESSGEQEDSEAPDSQSVEMTDANAAEENEQSAASNPPAADAQPATEVSTSSQEGLAYQKRTATGNIAAPVAVDDLDEQRVAMRENLVDRSLDILNSHDDVTFELADLISAAVAKASDPVSMRTDIGSTLVQSLISFQMDDDFRAQGKKIASSAHLLALVIQDKDFYEAVVNELKENLGTLLGFIKIFPDQPAEESSPWIGQVLVIVERLLAEDQLPPQIQWTPPTNDSPEVTSVEDIPEPTVALEDKYLLFDALVEILPRIGKEESLALSIMRIFVMLTRTRKIALRLAEKRNIQRLFLMVKQLAGITNDSLRSAFMIVLRHIIEDEGMIRQIMRSEIQNMFESRDRRNTDTTGYTRQMFYLAIRAPEIFVEVTNEKLQLSRYDPNQRPQQLALKKEDTRPANTEEPGSTNAGSSSEVPESDRPKASSEPVKQPVLERTKTSDLKLPVVESPDGVIHYLLCELLAYKEIDDKPEPPKPSDKTDQFQDDESASGAPGASSTTPASEQVKTEKAEFKADANPIYIYRCFILKCLAELLQSYNRTKIEFINFSRRADPHATTPSKPRSGVLNYLLNSLVPVGTLNHEGDVAFKKKLATSGCAIDVIVSLCAKTGEYGGPKPGQGSPYDETEMDLLFVRKFVLEHALKAFKDACSSEEGLDMKYSRLLGLADIFSRMVAQRPSGEMVTQISDLSPTLKQMAKIMYEKNFISTLTTAIADVDLNFPNAKRVVKYILKPLKWLCYVAMDLSTRYDTSSAPESTEEWEISSASDDDLLETTREETPDLFRNSTLGMFEPGNESESEGSDEEVDEEMEMYDEAYGDEMEFEEEIGDNDEVVSEDEEMEMELGEMGPIEGLPGDVDVEIELDDEIDDIGTDDDSLDDDDEDEDDEDEDEDDEDDDHDDDEDMEGLDELDEITGDDENASLADDHDDRWIEDEVYFPAVGAGDASMAPGDLFVIDQPPQQLLSQLQRDFNDDIMQEEEDDEEEDEEEDFDDDEGIAYDAGMEDEDADMDMDMGWTWDEGLPTGGRPPHRLSPWMFPGGPDNRILVPAYRTQRPGPGSRMADDGMNPLLQRSGRSGGRGEHFPGGHGMSDWVHAIEARGPRIFSETGPVSFISNLLNAMSQGTLSTHTQNGALHLSLNTPLGLPPPLDHGFNRVARLRDPLSRSSRDDPQSAVSFIKAYTNQRWQEEARILYGNSAPDKGTRLVNSILKIMVPPALEMAKKRQEEREAEAARKLKEEQERKREQAERAEREEKEKKEREERERQEREAAEAAAQAANQNQSIDQAAAEGDAIPTSTDAQAMEGVQSTGSPSNEQGATAETEEPTRRVTTMLRGHEYDITDLGIDMEYLEALPEDLREEVLMQQIQERRAQQAQSRSTAQNAGAAENTQDAAEESISEEFLAALPPEIRAELLESEAAERRRREREEARRRAQAANPEPPQPDDIDTASFFATLDPALRQAVLMDQDEEVLRQLPPEISAEARALGGDRRLNQFDYLPPGYTHRSRGRPPQEDPAQKRRARPCVQMLDKAGVATLLRLMFIPQQGSAKASLTQILRYVCENRQNRAEVISILLSILQDGSADVNAVERSFAQLSLRAKQAQQQTSDKTPKLSRKNGALSINSDVSPLMVVQQCLNTLTQLTEKNPAVWTFFLSEHETGVGFKGRGNRKGKAKETKATKFPINALLSLLDRKLIVESSSIMEQLTMLLKVITAPLPVIKKNEEKAEAEAKKEEAKAAEDTSSGDTTTAEQPAQTGDTEMTNAPPADAPQPAAAQDVSTVADEGSANKSEAPKTEEEKKKHRTLTPPEIPESNLRLVAKILAARECNSKVFQGTLDVIGNLSPIPGSKEIFGKELLGIAQDLARSTLKDLNELTAQVSNAASVTDVQGIALSKFSPPSSDQAKLLRALTALDYLFDPNRDKKEQDKTATEGLEPSQKDDILLTLYEDSAFAPLWNKLGECLTVIRQRGNMLNIATTLLPLIETLMVVCKNTPLKDKDAPSSKTHPKDFALNSPPPESRMENLFFNFTEEHRKILNDLVRQNPKLMSGTFSLLVKNSKVLEFDNKRNYFNRKIHARSAERATHQPLQISVRRDQVFLDSFKSLYFKTADEMKYGKLSIRFHGEEGVDAGGVTREWFQVIARQMFNPDYCLFIPVASDRTTFHPNRLSAVNPEHTMFFKFIGRVIGKALYEGRVLDCHFSRAVYKRILGRPVNLKDMETLDLEYYKSLLWMLENDITDIITETFSTEVEVFGETEVVDLIENGRNIQVTEDNKGEYVRLVTQHRLTGAVQEQLEYFLKGFHDIIPAELISIFSEQELELLISGLPDINIEDWKANTEYHNYTQNSPQIHWFWRAVRSFDKEEQAKLLQFVTGTSKVPLNGFKELEGMNGFSKFNIHRDYGSKDRLPSSHTCFNQLDLPEYDDYEALKKALYTAMTAGGEYFGFA